MGDHSQLPNKVKALLLLYYLPVYRQFHTGLLSIRWIWHRPQSLVDISNVIIVHIAQTKLSKGERSSN